MTDRRKAMPWTYFNDMHSGGGIKEPPYEHIYIEAPVDEAKVIFFNRFGHNPERVSCTCCGDDYSIQDSETLEQVTGFQRASHYDSDLEKYIEKPNDNIVKAEPIGPEKEAEYLAKRFIFPRFYVSLELYLKRKDVLVIRSTEIKEEERHGQIPEQGFVWVD